MTTYQGSCHCGAMKFSVDLDLTKGGSRCNCSICQRTSAFTQMTKPADFHLAGDEAALGAYAFGGKTGTRYFCKTCGIHGYGRGYLEQVGGAYVSVNLNCLEGVDPSALAVGYWDGRHDNWQGGMASKPWPV